MTSDDSPGLLQIGSTQAIQRAHTSDVLITQELQRDQFRCPSCADAAVMVLKTIKRKFLDGSQLQ